MDPWLEAPSVWKGFHDALIVKTVEMLQPGLNRDGYFIDIGERVWIAEDERGVWPDHLIFHTPHRESSTGQHSVAVADEPHVIEHFRAGESMREIFAEIRKSAGRDLVTSIEIVSPTNKRDGKGRDLYQQKQRELGDSGVHLVEIDLLRGGTQIFDVPEAVLEGIRPWDYIINLSRRGSRRYELYAVEIRSPLPRIKIPLKSDHPDAVLDLQQAVDYAYQIGAYPMRIEYARNPVPSLSPEDAKWADEILKEHGLRK
jgi:hypothetical protein